MYEKKLVVVFILFLSSFGVRCFGSIGRGLFGDSGDYDMDDDHIEIPPWHNSNCDDENQRALAEIKSEIQDLQHLVVGLRQKLDPDFKLPPTPESKCPTGFKYVKQAKSCYKIVYEEHSWTSADQRCRGLNPGVHLVAITTSDENIGLKAFLKRDLAKNSHVYSRIRRKWGEEGRFWTSGQRLNETSCADQFVWKISNDKQLPLSFTSWHKNEPNCYLNEVEGCLQIKSYFQYNWNDVPCDLTNFPLCEFDPLQ